MKRWPWTKLPHDDAAYGSNCERPGCFAPANRVYGIATTCAKESAMLVLTRKNGQKIRIGEHITVTILRVKGKSVRVGIDAPDDVRIVRSELPPRPFDDDATSEPSDVEVPRERSRAVDEGARAEAWGGRFTEPDTARRSLGEGTRHPSRSRTRYIAERSTTSVRLPSRLGPASLGPRRAR